MVVENTEWEQKEKESFPPLKYELVEHLTNQTNLLIHLALMKKTREFRVSLVLQALLIFV